VTGRASGLYNPAPIIPKGSSSEKVKKKYVKGKLVNSGLPGK